MGSRLEEFKRGSDYLICIDSDGCAMDTMDIKHYRCFGPCMVAEWGLEVGCAPCALERYQPLHRNPRHQPLQGPGDNFCRKLTETIAQSPGFAPWKTGLRPPGSSPTRVWRTPSLRQKPPAVRRRAAAIRRGLPAIRRSPAARRP